MPGYHNTPHHHAIDLVGDVVWDTHLAVPHLPTPGREARATERARRIGGTASHVARWLHLLAQTGLYPSEPPMIRLWAALDALASRELAFCDTSACPIVPQLGEVYVLNLRDGEKAMMSYVPPDLPQHPLPARSSLLYLSAYTLLAPDAGQQIVETCARLVAQGTQLVFDLSPLVQQIDAVLIQRLVALACVALGNEEEWRAIFKTTDGEESARAALALGAGSIHLKRGEHGSILFRADGSSVEFPAQPSQPRSSAGAGDAYTAATLAALASGLDEIWGGKLASYCGALHTEQRPDAENIASVQAYLTTLRP
ncbi:MAG TPA: carbohydrate kinase family protein [Ktedonobacterales bacterium]|nr:carbohydrate kinase family protein [Ktedonobacterales bacterium]